jgi:putative ABC transport system substrate-binding protein
LEASLGGKWLELLSEIAPGLKRAAIMFTPDTFSASTFLPPRETAARALKVEPIIVPVRSVAEVEAGHHKPWARAGKRRCRHAGCIPGRAPLADHNGPEIESAIIALGREPGGGLVVQADGFMVAHRAPIISAAARSRVPAVYVNPDFVRNGGLLSYGVDYVDPFRRAASYVDRILRGAKPGDLPVQFPTKFEMVVNRKTATALGLTVPPSIMLRADEVIE